MADVSVLVIYLFIIVSIRHLLSVMLITNELLEPLKLLQSRGRLTVSFLPDLWQSI